MTDQTTPGTAAIRAFVDSAKHIVIIQADNPDADSLGSALALEQILGDLGHELYLYCGVDVPEYLRYLPGWDRVQNELPATFDASIIVDASTYTLFGQLEKTAQFGGLQRRPCLVIDHHRSVERPLDFAAISHIDAEAAATGEMIFLLAHTLGWTINQQAADFIMAAILGDTQGLMNNQTSAATYRIMADLTDLGADRPMLEELRREYSRMPESIYRYKGELIARTEFLSDGRIATVTIPQDEINLHSPLYNPAVLVQFDSLQVSGVKASIIFKTYDDGHMTAKIRTNISAPIGDKLAEQFGGGGHRHSSGFKVADGQSFAEVKTEAIKYATKLLDELVK
jgi:phosphoesterase RecJ-like protein